MPEYLLTYCQSLLSIRWITIYYWYQGTGNTISDFITILLFFVYRQNPWSPTHFKSSICRRAWISQILRVWPLAFSELGWPVPRLLAHKIFGIRQRGRCHDSCRLFIESHTRGSRLPCLRLRQKMANRISASYRIFILWYWPTRCQAKCREKIQNQWSRLWNRK